MNKSRFCGRCFASHTVDLCAFSLRYANPEVGCCVRMSYVRNLDSRVVTTSCEGRRWAGGGRFVKLVSIFGTQSIEMQPAGDSRLKQMNGFRAKCDRGPVATW